MRPICGAVHSVAEGQIAPVAAEEFAALLMAPLGPFPKVPRMVVGVSGGPHSLALFLLLRRWGADACPVIVDHGLRPESGHEAEGVAAMLASLGAQPRVVRLGLKRGPAVQARARDARLATLAAVALAEGRPWVALGHHAQDQAETVLLRRNAGSGPIGLAGMAPSRATPEALLIRPLLGVPPSRLEAVVAAAGLLPVRDPSNNDPRFARVRARAVLSPEASAALLSQARGFSRQRADLDCAVALRIALAAAILPEGFARLDLQALGKDAVAEATLAALVRIIGGARYTPGRDAVRRLLERGFGSLGGAVLAPEGVLTRETADLAAAVPAVAGALWDGRWRLDRAAPGCMVGAVGGRLRARHAPSRAAATLPALWREETLVAVPALGYAQDDDVSRCRLTFEPGSGPLT